MKTVLVIAYFFPPLGGPGAQRALKFARYLPQFGWRPVVLSVRDSPYPSQDQELLSQIPDGVPVHRATTVEPEQLYRWVQRLVPRPRQPAGSQVESRTQTGTARPSVAARLQSSLFIPDGRIGWYPFAVRLGQRVLRAEQPSAVFSTSAPYTAHLIARRLAASADLPWVLDLRDPWVDNHFDPPPTRWHRHLHRWLEGRCVDRANRVVCVTPSMTDEMRNRYPGELQSKFATITNGFDPKDFDRELAPDPTRFSIRHVGSLYAGRSAIPFLRGLLLAMARDAALQARLDVEFIGAMDRDNRQAWEAFVAAHELQPWVSSRAFVPHHHAVGLMQQSQVQLLIAGKGLGLDRVYTAKLFEYLGARRPILAVAPPGVAATLIQESGAGIVADPESPEDIADAILTLYSWYRQGRLREWSPQGIEAYDRCHLTGQLASLLNALVEQEHA